ncbi:hypothetical protein XH80_12000 [Bradyrhizobium sp. CCBAU 45384]|nr:hypothetical protein [Bradyrhizobium sp. CCBAU 45384]
MAVSRKLVAVFAADVEGYSRLMGADEVGTLKELTERRTILDKLIGDHRGRIANTAGDSVLAEFGSAVDAVQCAVDAQAALAKANAGIPSDKQINFRIGVHIGDVMLRAGDLFGDGVNIAARLQTLATPGAVCISGATFDQVRKVMPMTFVELGAQQVKNIQEPIRAYLVDGTKELREVAARIPDFDSLPPLPDKPSIAVLPFQNMSDDPEQDHFADGVVEDIITALSRFKWLFVIARNSSFAFKGKAVDVKDVGRRLGVRYVLEGSVRKAASKVRITCQLIDALTGAHLWADRFDGSLDNFFDLQDQVASGVVGAIDPKILTAEMMRVKRKTPSHLNAYDCFLRASDHIYSWTDESTEEALRLLYQAIELDKEYAQAYGFASYCYIWRWTVGRMRDGDLEEARRLSRAAIRFGMDDGFSLAWGGSTLAFFASNGEELKEGASIVDKALMLNPNLARSWNLSGWVRLFLGEPDLAIAHLQQAMRLSPLDLAFHAMEAAMAHAHLSAGRYDEAVAWAERAIRDQPNQGDALAAMVVAHAGAGRLEKARDATRRLLQIRPHKRISNYFLPHQTAEGRAFIGDLLRKAGLPE